MSTSAEGRRRTHDFRPVKALPAAKEPKADWLKAMAEKLASEEGRALYKRRRQTVEPVFGVIKAVLGFAGFSLRGLEKVEGEWTLVALARNQRQLSPTARRPLQLQALAQAEPGDMRRLGGRMS